MDFLKIAISGYKKLLILLVVSLITVSGLSSPEKISAQMPPMGNMGGMGGMMGNMGMTYEPSNCRNNPGTGEVFCDVKLDVSMMSMTQTTAPSEHYEGQGVWFQGCVLPGQDFENFDTAWIERNFNAVEGRDNSDPNKIVTHVYFRGNMPTPPGEVLARCKYQFFTKDSSLVQPGGPYHSPQWESDQETQRMYEEADRIRKDAERKRAEEELLMAKQQAELELQMQEEMRKQQAAQNSQNNNSPGIQNIFGQGPVGNIFGGSGFQAPPDNEVPIGPFINLTQIATEDRWKVMECIANTIEGDVGMQYEQAYLEFAFPLGVRMLDEPDFYYDSVTNCMHLSFSKLLSGGFGGRTSNAGEAPREEINAMMEACIVPHLSDNLNVSRQIIMEDLVSVETGKRSVSPEEMRAAYDCWMMFENGNVANGYFPLQSDLLVSYIFGDQEIPGESCMIDSIADAQRGNFQDAERIVADLVNFAVGRSDQWGFLESDANPQHKTEVVNRVIGCNQELEWLRDYQRSISGADDNFTINFERMMEPDFEACIVGEFESYVGLEDPYDIMLDIVGGMIDENDPTEYINRPLGEDQFHSMIYCVDQINAEQVNSNAVEPFLRQYTTFLDQIQFDWSEADWTNDDKFNYLMGCTVDTWENRGSINLSRDVDDKYITMEDIAEPLLRSIFFEGGWLNEIAVMNREYGAIELEDVWGCMDSKPEFEWVAAFHEGSDYDYEPLFESDIFTQTSGDFQQSAASFRETIQSDKSFNPNGMDANMVSGSLTGGGALENLRQELVNMAMGSNAEDCMVANLAREKQETENYIKTSYIDGLVWNPNKRPSKKEQIALQNCDSQIRSVTQGKGGLNVLLKFGSSGDPDYFTTPSDSQRACMISEYSKQFGYMIESAGMQPTEAAAKAVAEVSMPGEYDGFHPILGESAPNLRPPSAIEFEAFSNCKIFDLHVYEGSKLRKLIPGIDTSELPIGDLSNPTNLAIVGILITLFFSILQMVRGK